MLFEAVDRMYDGDKYGYLALVLMMFQKEAILFARKLKVSEDVGKCCSLIGQNIIVIKCLFFLFNSLILVTLFLIA